MRIVLEGHGRRLQMAVALDVHLVEPVDENVGDLRIPQKHLERPQTEQLVQYVGDQALALEEAERCGLSFTCEQVAQDGTDFRLGVFAGGMTQPVEIQDGQQLLVDTRFQRLVIGAPRIKRGGCGGSGKLHGSAPMRLSTIAARRACPTAYPPWRPKRS